MALTERALLPFVNREVPQVINMCGSGVTACRNILAMGIAGWVGTRLCRFMERVDYRPIEASRNSEVSK